MNGSHLEPRVYMTGSRHVTHSYSVYTRASLLVSSPIRPPRRPKTGAAGRTGVASPTAVPLKPPVVDATGTRFIDNIGSRPSDHYFRSACLSVCLSVCLFVCTEFFSAVFDPSWIKLGHMLYVRV